MFNRQILSKLTDWKNRSDRKPLILRGARQVGKTTAVNIFSETFDNYISLNLELGKDRNIFKDELSVQETFQAIQIVKNIELKKGNTLIFIDEIQQSPSAIRLLRYFYEELSEIFVIAAGSLLEIVLEKTEISFPVGRIEYLYMYPLTFEEYLEAKGEKLLLEAMDKIPLPEYTYSKLLDLFHEYTLIGGMPEVIKHYIEHQDVKSLNRIYESLLISYINDSRP